MVCQPAPRERTRRIDRTQSALALHRVHWFPYPRFPSTGLVTTPLVALVDIEIYCTKQLSKRLTYTLRHGADKVGLQLRADGFASLDELLSKPSFRGVSQQQVEEVVSAAAVLYPTSSRWACGRPGILLMC